MVYNLITYTTKRSVQVEKRIYTLKKYRHTRTRYILYIILLLLCCISLIFRIVKIILTMFKAFPHLQDTSNCIFFFASAHARSLPTSVNCIHM